MGNQKQLAILACMRKKRQRIREPKIPSIATKNRETERPEAWGERGDPGVGEEGFGPKLKGIKACGMEKSVRPFSGQKKLALTIKRDTGGTRKDKHFWSGV